MTQLVCIFVEVSSNRGHGYRNLEYAIETLADAGFPAYGVESAKLTDCLGVPPINSITAAKSIVEVP